jgi:hypothetical protein
MHKKSFYMFNALLRIIQVTYAYTYTNLHKTNKIHLITLNTHSHARTHNTHTHLMNYTNPKTNTTTTTIK